MDTETTAAPREPALFQAPRLAPVYRSKPDGDLDPAGEAGWYLQREREKRGLSLEAAGEETGVHPYHIEAIEFGDMTRMPGRSEAINMIGNYATFLGFDAEPLVKHYADFLAAPVLAPRNHPANPAPLSSARILDFTRSIRAPRIPQIDWSRIAGGMPGGAGGIVASVFGAMVLFAGVSYYGFPGGDAPATQQVAKVETPADIPADKIETATTGEQAIVKVTEETMPDAAVAEGNGAAPEEAAADETLTAEEVESAGLDSMTAFIEEKVQIEAAAAPAKKKSKAKGSEDPVTTQAISAADGRIFGAENADSRLVLRAKAPVWVRIEDQSGNVIMTQMLMKGDIYRVPSRPGLIAIARDGGLIGFEIDGKEKGILGPAGEILVGRPLDIPVLEKDS